MARLLPKHFKFSWSITLICLVLMALMVRASAWQWERYKYKRELVNSYELHSVSPPLPFPRTARSAEEFADYLHRKVYLKGTYDFERQVIVTNRRHATGPGHWLMTPLKLEGTDTYVIVSRGFIPFAERSPETWTKYDFSPEEQFDAILQPTVPHRSFLAPDNPDTDADSFEPIWLYPDIAKMAKQLPYNVLSDIYVERLGGPPEGLFPAEAVSVSVPPSTHFGYTIEWLLLAIATFTIGFLLQAFPRRFSKILPKEKDVPSSVTKVELPAYKTNGAYNDFKRSERSLD